jgi:hypothetical protein
MNLKAIIGAVSLVLILAVCAAGCTNPTQTAQSTAAPSSNKAIDYANAVSVNSKSHTESGQTTTVSKIIANGSDSARFTVGTRGPGNETGTVAITVNQFSSTNDASAFFDNATFGYTQMNGTSIANETAPYKLAFGHDATITNGMYKIDSFNFVTATATYVIQQDEFVQTWSVSVTN